MTVTLCEIESEMCENEKLDMETMLHNPESEPFFVGVILLLE